MSLENRILTALSCYQSISLGELSLEIDVKPDVLRRILHKMVEDKKIIAVIDKATKQDIYTLNVETPENQDTTSEDQDIISLLESMQNETDQKEDMLPFSSNFKVRFFPMKITSDIRSFFNSLHRIHIIRVYPDNPDFIETDHGIIAIQEIKQFLKKITKVKKSNRAKPIEKTS